MGKAAFPGADAAVEAGQQVEGLVGDAAQGGTKEARQGDKVTAELQVLEEIEEVEHLLTAVEPLPLHHVIRDAMPPQFPLERLQVGEATQQDGDVAEPRFSRRENSFEFRPRLRA